jgi:hypothetical protein
MTTCNDSNHALLQSAFRYQELALKRLQAARGNASGVGQQVSQLQCLNPKAHKQQEQIHQLTRQLQATALRLENQLVSLAEGLEIVRKELPPLASTQEEPLVVVE